MLAAEAAAEEEGAIAYLHLDAKYRIDTLTGLFGNDVPPASDNGETPDDVEEEKRQGKQTNTYRRGDLYKMHTYNEAIRRTVGSYVLYPGTDEADPEKKRHERYHEILPGVGAFVMRPKLGGNGEKFESAVGAEALGAFLLDVLRVQTDRFGQLHRLNYWIHQTTRTIPRAVCPGAWSPEPLTPPDDTPVLQFYVRSRASDFCKEQGFLFLHAVSRSGAPLALDPTTLSARFVVPYTGSRGGGRWLGWYGIVDTCRLLPLDELQKIVPDKYLGGGAAYYYLLRLTEEGALPIVLLPSRGPPRPGGATLCTWAHLFHHS
jgi:hypothetical protein